MDICIILDTLTTDDTAVMLLEQQWRDKHPTSRIRRIGMLNLSAQDALAQEENAALADLYLLKSGIPQALELARYLEKRGATLINSAAATLLCQDRTLLNTAMEGANLPWPHTQMFSNLHTLIADQSWLTSFAFPLIVKSTFSSLDDLISKVNNLEELGQLAASRGEEPVIIQEFVPGDGWDIKLWVVGETVFAARRRSPLADSTRKRGFQLDADEIDQEWINLALAVGRTLDIQVYGVDLLITEKGPLIVDVNAFHSCFGIIGFDEALVSFVESQSTLLPNRS